jgi:hypothetical protein
MKCDFWPSHFFINRISPTETNKKCISLINLIGQCVKFGKSIVVWHAFIASFLTGPLLVR